MSALAVRISTHGTVPLALARPLLHGLAALGADIDALRARMGVGMSPSPDARIPRERLQVVLDEASRGLREPDLGLRLAQALPVGSFGLTEYCGMASPTLRDGLREASRFMSVLTDGMTLVVHETLDETRVVHRLRPNARRIPHLLELAMATLASRCRDAVGDEMAFRRVCFSAPPPRDPGLYESHFRAPVVFDAPADELVLDSSLLGAPLRTADPTVAQAIGAWPGATTTEPGRDSFVAEVREAVRGALERGDVHVGTTAATLGTSVRTLQRRLGELGVSYTALVDDARRELALRLVGRRTTTEVAALLGFSNPGAFFRAFRRWTGTTPRAHLAAAGSSSAR
ncbi:MAG TPA: AraC family transcriptional regulator [Polyangiaceae bacterium]